MQYKDEVRQLTLVSGFVAGAVVAATLALLAGRMQKGVPRSIPGDPRRLP
jgi:uncharacterized membrane protein YoaK (UPF0700 family)